MWDVAVIGILVAALLLAAAFFFAFTSGAPRVIPRRSDESIPADVAFVTPVSDADLKLVDVNKRIVLTAEVPAVKNGVFIKRLDGIHRVPELSADDDVVNGRMVVTPASTFFMVRSSAVDSHMGMGVGIMLMSPADFFFGNDRPPNSIPRIDEKGDVTFSTPMSSSVVFDGKASNFGVFTRSAEITLLAVTNKSHEIVYFGVIEGNKISDIKGTTPKGLKVWISKSEIHYEYTGSAHLSVTVQE